jgi:hypothetical protein
MTEAEEFDRWYEEEVVPYSGPYPEFACEFAFRAWCAARWHEHRVFPVGTALTLGANGVCDTTTG